MQVGKELVTVGPGECDAPVGERGGEAEPVGLYEVLLDDRVEDRDELRTLLVQAGSLSTVRVQLPGCRRRRRTADRGRSIRRGSSVSDAVGGMAASAASIGARAAKMSLIVWVDMRAMIRFAVRTSCSVRNCVACYRITVRVGMRVSQPSPPRTAPIISHQFSVTGSTEGSP